MTTHGVRIEWSEKRLRSKVLHFLTFLPHAVIHKKCEQLPLIREASMACTMRTFAFPYISCGTYPAQMCYHSCTLVGCGFMWHERRVEGLCYVPYNLYTLV